MWVIKHEWQLQRNGNGAIVMQLLEVSRRKMFIQRHGHAKKRGERLQRYTLIHIKVPYPDGHLIPH